MIKHPVNSLSEKGVRLDGFTLVEICIVMALSGLVLVAAINLLQQYKAHEIISINNERLETIRKALATYVKDNDRLPCPARRDLASRNPGYGQSIANCTAGAAAGTVTVASPLPGPGSRQVRIGAVPVRSLKLGDPYMTDAWGNQFTYAVTEDLTVASTFNPTRSAINIIDAAGNSIMVPPGPDAAMYLVSSAGKDGKGAWTSEGKLRGGCGLIPGYDNENCNNDATFRVAPYSTSVAGEHFDDQLGYTNAIEETMYPICADGERLTSADGITFVCSPIEQPAPCGPNERLTSDGNTFSCVAISDAPTCGPGEYVTSADGVTLSCDPIPAPPAPPPALVLPDCNNNGQALTTNGTTLSCTTLPLKPVTKSCDAYALGSGWYGCSVTCDPGTTVTGGAVDGDNVQVDRGQYSGKSGNGWACRFQLSAGGCWSGSPPCGVRCFAECTDASN